MRAAKSATARASKDGKESPPPQPPQQHVIKVSAKIRPCDIRQGPLILLQQARLHGGEFFDIASKNKPTNKVGVKKEPPTEQEEAEDVTQEEYSNDKETFSSTCTAPSLSSSEATLPPCSIVTICHISDTHGNRFRLPKADILIHSGDFTNFGIKDKSMKEVESFLQWWNGPEMRESFRFRVLVPGNHELEMDKLSHLELGKMLGGAVVNPNAEEDEAHQEACLEESQQSIVLLDSGVELCGLKIYGSPWTNCGMAWSLSSNDRGKAFAKIPSDTDVLVTHSPPKGILDGPPRLGCAMLKYQVEKQTMPPLHLFGHVHAGNGMVRLKKHDPASTVYSNAALQGSACCNFFQVVVPN